MPWTLLFQSVLECCGICTTSILSFLCISYGTSLDKSSCLVEKSLASSYLNLKFLLKISTSCFTYLVSIWEILTHPFSKFPLSKWQVYTTKNLPKSFDYQDFMPLVDKTMDPSWQKMVDNERFTLSKGILLLLD